ncbi:MAG: acyl-CoA synthetase FdrA [Acidobacteria bacterium]|nr:acyl-CoA synthetase FdrA [Acidobacteriota bacterium]
MSILRHVLKRGRYFDSVLLMQLQRGLADLPGVHEAGVVMATEANQRLMVESALLREPLAGARADDLLIAVSAETGKAADEALGRFDELIKGRRAGTVTEYRPKSLAVALDLLPSANWVLVSVPGRHAAEVARQALAADRNVFLYSDNVAIAEEVALKKTAGECGRLVLGPDCGTAIVAGVGLGFANRVRRGPVGLIGASGTGLQTIASRIHALGLGVSQAIGIGGRDLSREVGGATASQALALLAGDSATGVVVIVSKPPHPEVAERLLAQARAVAKPVVLQFQGYAVPGRRLGNLHFAVDLEDAAHLAVELAERSADDGAPEVAVDRGALRGLFSGGTLASEAYLRLSALLPDVASNLSGNQAAKLGAQSAPGHSVLDLGADELTLGRPHPMIDPELVVEHLARVGEEKGVGTILLDVVLGDGAHPDPAALLAPAVERVLAARDDLEILAVLVGTDEDPQDLEAQHERLEEVGARVFTSLGAAVDAGLGRVATASAGRSPQGAEALEPPLVAVNIGVELFHEALVAQGVETVHVDWRPPAGGNEKLARILARLEGSTMGQAK